MTNISRKDSQNHIDDGDYEKMTGATRLVNESSDTYETLNDSLIDDTPGYEDMSPDKYKQIICAENHDTEYEQKYDTDAYSDLTNTDNNEVYDYLKLVDDESPSDYNATSDVTNDNKTDNFDAYAKLPPLPPPRIHPSEDVRENLTENKLQKTAPVPKPRL